MPLISHDYNFILLRTRKTASTSTEMYLQPYCTPPGTPVEEWCEAIVSDHGIVGQRLGKVGRAGAPPPGVVRDVWFSHQPASALKSRLGKEKWSTYTKITIVRNPFEKVRSAFSYRRKARIKNLTLKEQIPLFRQMVKNGRYHTDEEIVFTGLKRGKPRFEPNVILKKENLEADLRNLSIKLGLDPSKSALPSTKVAIQKPSQIPLSEWYDAETIDCVRRRLAWMFEYGGYQDLP